MSQSDIFDLLKRKRLSGDEEYFTAEQIRKNLKINDIHLTKESLQQNLKQLRRYGFVEYNITKDKVLGKVNYVYRLKKQFL